MPLAVHFSVGLKWAAIHKQPWYYGLLNTANRLTDTKVIEGWAGTDTDGLAASLRSKWAAAAAAAVTADPIHRYNVHQWREPRQQESLSCSLGCCCCCWWWCNQDTVQQNAWLLICKVFTGRVTSQVLERHPAASACRSQPNRMGYKGCKWVAELFGG